MHGQQNIKFCTAKQAKQIYKYKNIKTKLYKNNAAIWYNKTCRMKQVTPGYISIKVNGNQHAGHSPCQCVIPEDVLIHLFPPDDERLSLETCRGGKINTLKKVCQVG
jgi:hypothetical protein